MKRKKISIVIALVCAVCVPLLAAWLFRFVHVPEPVVDALAPVTAEAAQPTAETQPPTVETQPPTVQIALDGASDASPTDPTVTTVPTTAPPPRRVCEIAAVGDVLLDYTAGSILDGTYGQDLLVSPDLQELLRNADIALANLETAVTERGTPMEDKQFTFRAKTRHADYLKYLGIDIVSLANNHVLDFGQIGFTDTLKYLDDNGIDRVGGGYNTDDARAMKTYEVNDVKVGFLAASRIIPVVEWYVTDKRPGVLPTYDPAVFNSLIAAADPLVDVLIVYIHWGVEATTVLRDYQTKLAHGYIDHGADVVLGSHPHVLQAMEYYKGKPIAYSLGNFIFTNYPARDTMLLRLFYEEGDMSVQIVPARIKHYKTYMLTGDDRHSLLEHMRSISINAVIDEDGFVTAKA